jgi:hypothetical protein
MRALKTSLFVSSGKRMRSLKKIYSQVGAVEVETILRREKSSKRLRRN